MCLNNLPIQLSQAFSASKLWNRKLGLTSAEWRTRGVVVYDVIGWFGDAAHPSYCVWWVLEGSVACKDDVYKTPQYLHSHMKILYGSSIISSVIFFHSVRAWLTKTTLGKSTRKEKTAYTLLIITSLLLQWQLWKSWYVEAVVPDQPWPSGSLVSVIT